MRARSARAIGGRGQAVPAERARFLLIHQPGLTQQTEVPGHAGLGDAQDGRQLRDVERLLRQQPQQPEAGLVAEKAKDGGAHIYKSTCMYTDWQERVAWGAGA